MTNNKQTKFKTLDMVYIALFTVLIAVCSWITIPTEIPFTLQTFAIFCAVGLLGGKKGTLSVVVYIILGAIGVPVFAGFRGGFGWLLSTTGGYIIGFIFMALSYWLITGLFGKKVFVSVLAMLVGLALCYTFGTLWFMFAYAKSVGAVGLSAVLGWCVIPYIIPDLVKIAIATILIKRLAPHVKL